MPPAPRRPVIGITTDHDGGRSQHQVSHGYVAAVERAGGLPIILPYAAATDPAGEPDPRRASQMLDLVDGLLMTGGRDPDPAAWGEPWHPGCVPIDPAREASERLLLAEAVRRRTPVLGICFGMQLMNVARPGGSLIQFLPDHSRDEPIEHRKLAESDWQRRHPMRLDPDSALARRAGVTEVSVNTNHRQAVGKVGKGLTPFAVAPDGVVEGVEDSTLPLYVGVQWHPERLTDDPAHAALFDLLIDAARQRSAEAESIRSR